MIRVAVFGYGNVGKAAVEACLASKDIELVSIVDTRSAGSTVSGIEIIPDMSGLPDIDVAVLALPSRAVPDVAGALLKKGVCTVDGFDIHTEIGALRDRLSGVAKSSGAVSITAAGWDPGTDSIIRTLLMAMAPKGITYTDFGPGMSMGHSVAAKAIGGVKDALSMTIPTGTGVHRRMVYVELESGADVSAVTAAIKADDYFAHDETIVTAVPSVDELKDMGHGVHIERKGVSGATQNQLFEFNMKINNPALTAQVLVSAARAAVRQQPGCYTLIEIPPVDFLDMTRDEAVHLLV